MYRSTALCLIFFLNDTWTPKFSSLSLHDGLPIFLIVPAAGIGRRLGGDRAGLAAGWLVALAPGLVVVPANQGGGSANPFILLDRKSTRLNSSHANISYAVFCLIHKTSLPRFHFCT